MLSRLSINATCKVLLNINVASQKIITCKRSYLVCAARNVSLKNNTIFNFHKHSTALGVFSVRQQSTGDVTPDKVPLSEIPDPPIPQIQEVVETVMKYHPNGEPTFENLGLGGYTPVGIVENCMEYLHIGLDLPWWGAIALGTLCIRFTLFPLVIKSQKNAAKTINHMPEVQRIQLRMTEARQSGNDYEAAMYAEQLHRFMKEKNINPFMNFAVAAVQIPVFLSFYLGLTNMANVPVESLKHGGLFHFTDLTVPDPFCVLPLLTCATVLLTIELGVDINSSHSVGNLKYFLRATPIIMFPFIYSFPAGILYYWTCTSVVSLVQVGILRIPKVRDFFNIPPRQVHDAKNLPMKPKSFVSGLKSSWSNIKLAHEMADRKRADTVQFNTAGRGPIKKTYKYDPTKQARDGTTIMARKR